MKPAVALPANGSGTRAGGRTSQHALIKLALPASRARHSLAGRRSRPVRAKEENKE